jgi:phosphatidate phosphatase APP1
MVVVYAYRPVSEFLISGNSGFPEGSFHMKSLQKNLFSKSTWKDLAELAMYESGSFEQKVSQISLIMERFPLRQFILVGDSGEKDPEVYRAIQARFSEQVLEIWIRDVVNDREKNPDRLAGMHIIQSGTGENASMDFLWK